MKFILSTLAVILLIRISNAQDWQLIGFEDYEIEYVYAKGDTIWVCTRDSTYKREVFYSFSMGGAWNKVDDSDSLINGWLKLIKVTPDNNLNIYATAGNGRGLKSADGGQNWKTLFPDLEPWPGTNTRLTDVFISPHNTNTIFAIIKFSGAAFRTDNLFRSDDKGKNWQPVETGFPASSHGSTFTIALDPIDSTKMYAAVDNEFGDWFFYVSLNNGMQWTFRTYLERSNLQIIPNFLNPDTIFVFPGAARSIDNGYIWSRTLKEIIKPDSLRQPRVVSSIQIPNPPYNILTSIIKWDSTFSFRETLGIFKNVSKFDDWILIPGSNELNLGISYNPNSLFIDSNTNKLYVGTREGLYSYGLITSIKGEENYPNDFILYQNYPNPFNNSTMISYQLAINSNVSLKIYNIAGKEIKTLVNQWQVAGKHSVNFDATNFSSGIYFYRIKTSSGSSRSRRMILIK